MRDKYSNLFDVENDLVHKTVAKEDFLKLNLSVLYTNGSVLAIPVQLIETTYVNGSYSYEYTVDEPYEGVLVLEVRTLDTDEYYDQKVAEGLTQAQLDALTYDDSLYKHIRGSPFVIASSVLQSTALLETYEDILRGGLAMSTKSFLNFTEPIINVSSTTPFRV